VNFVVLCPKIVFLSGLVSSLKSLPWSDPAPRVSPGIKPEIAYLIVFLPSVYLHAAGFLDFIFFDFGFVDFGFVDSGFANFDFRDFVLSLLVIDCDYRSVSVCPFRLTLSTVSLSKSHVERSLGLVQTSYFIPLAKAVPPDTQRWVISSK